MLTTFFGILGFACMAAFVVQMTLKKPKAQSLNSTTDRPGLLESVTVPPPPPRKTKTKMMEKPVVAFPWEPLTDLAGTCATKFTQAPLLKMPQVFLSPAHYFPKKMCAVYIPHTGEQDVMQYASHGAIYLKDEYVNTASPEDLERVMMTQLIHSWLQQYYHFDDPDSDKYIACLEVGKKLLGIHV